MRRTHFASSWTCICSVFASISLENDQTIQLIKNNKRTNFTHFVFSFNFPRTHSRFVRPAIPHSNVHKTAIFASCKKTNWKYLRSQNARWSYNYALLFNKTIIFHFFLIVTFEKEAQFVIVYDFRMAFAVRSPIQCKHNWWELNISIGYARQREGH